MEAEDRRQDQLVKEYQFTQEMIRHYDDLIMRFAAITQTGVLIFIGLAFGLLSKDKDTFFYLFPVVIIFVTICNILVHLWFKRHRSVSQLKIHRILEIEKELGWRQFSVVDEAIKTGKIESAPVRKMLFIYHLGLPTILVVAYLVIIFCG
jgi:hypothetical protein